MARRIPARILECILLKITFRNLIPCIGVCRKWKRVCLVLLGRLILRSGVINLQSQDLHFCQIQRLTDFFERYPNEARLYDRDDCFRVAGYSQGWICSRKHEFGSVLRSGFVITLISSDRIIRVLPTQPSSRHCCIGFGFDYRNADHKVVLISRELWGTEMVLRLEVYSCASSSWNTITTLPNHTAFAKSSMLHVQGMLYTIVERTPAEPFILGFDLVNESLTEIKLPQALAAAEFCSLDLVKQSKSSIVALYRDHRGVIDAWLINTGATGEEGDWKQLNHGENIGPEHFHAAFPWTSP